MPKTSPDNYLNIFDVFSETQKFQTKDKLNFYYGIEPTP